MSGKLVKSSTASSSMLYGSVYSAESIKVIAESIGVGTLSDDAAKELGEDISIKLKRIVQDAAKFRNHAKRQKLLISDIDMSLKVRNVEPQYGFVSKDHIPFRFASGGGRELHFTEDKEIDLSEITANNMVKIPLDSTLRSHWFVVEGIQPTVPENPPPLSKDSQFVDSVNPVIKLDQGLNKDAAGKPTTGKIHKLKNVETIHVKQLATHELSVEQQLYYKEITEACVGSDEPRRGEALQSLGSDPGLHEMLPRMCTFIAEGVKVNVVQNNLALLIYLMRMVRALLDNPSLFLEKYLHELIPSVMTCIVSKQLCMRPELDNHWALRDFASRLMAQICKTFNTLTNNLQTRVTRIFSKALQNDKTHLSSLYGSIAGLSELGGEVIKVFIIPRLAFISERIEPHLLGTSISNTDKTAAGHIRAMLQKCCPPILKQMRAHPDIADEYKSDFGFLGPSLCQAVVKARNAPASIVTISSNAINTAPITSAAQTATAIGRVNMPSSQRQGPVVSTLPQIRALQSNQQPQKFVIVTQNAQQQQQSQQAKVVRRGSSPHSVVLSAASIAANTSNSNSSSGSGNVSNLNSGGSLLSSRSNDNVCSTLDANSLIIETEIVRAPPELDDLTHLE
ncbi:transcription initiation factor TFIID subunit 6 isoform X2 [Drosophila obscura]|uniref:transcription initiation factor TFIID subunit 6 isoform X2 n=1 Tax=Drosophila obscura TaxID=7282 RepID=UPI001BB285EC|nr:transcription initiation factor TFIID subunit 6 isoform X2 [Drosophila obscura]